MPQIFGNRRFQSAERLASGPADHRTKGHELSVPGIQRGLSGHALSDTTKERVSLRQHLLVPREEVSETRVETLQMSVQVSASSSGRAFDRAELVRQKDENRARRPPLSKTPNRSSVKTQASRLPWRKAHRSSCETVWPVDLQFDPHGRCTICDRFLVSACAW